MSSALGNKWVNAYVNGHSHVSHTLTSISVFVFFGNVIILLWLYFTFLEDSSVIYILCMYSRDTIMFRVFCILLLNLNDEAESIPLLIIQKIFYDFCWVL